MLTIAIPVYERIDFFDEALKSVLSQTKPVQIIVVDNASSHTYFKEAVQKCSSEFVTYHRNDTNIGMYGNWNRCIELCTTDYVTIMGDDDIIHPTFAETFYNTLEKYPDLTCFHTDIERFGDSAELNLEGSKMPFGYCSGTELLKYAAKHGLGISTVSMAFSKKVYPTFQFEYVQWPYSQDWLFAYKAFADGTCYGETKKLMKYRVHKKGNALAVGMKAYLSSVLVYHEIYLRLKNSAPVEAKMAYEKERAILRNAVMSENAQLALDMMADKGNPFGIHLSQLLKNDPLCAMYLQGGGIKKRVSLLLLRLQRKINYLSK